MEDRKNKILKTVANFILLLAFIVPFVIYISERIDCEPTTKMCSLATVLSIVFYTAPLCLVSIVLFIIAAIKKKKQSIINQI